METLFKHLSDRQGLNLSDPVRTSSGGSQTETDAYLIGFSTSFCHSRSVNKIPCNVLCYLGLFFSYIISHPSYPQIACLHFLDAF